MSYYVVHYSDGSEGYLAHYGVKGMKWGVWNEDTRARYGFNGNASRKVKNQVNELTGKVKARYGFDRSISKDTKKAIRRASFINAYSNGAVAGSLVGLITGQPHLAAGTTAAITALSYPFSNLSNRKQYKKGKLALDALTVKTNAKGKPVNKEEEKKRRNINKALALNAAMNTAILAATTAGGRAIVTSYLNSRPVKPEPVAKPKPSLSEMLEAAYPNAEVKDNDYLQARIDYLNWLK